MELGSFYIHQFSVLAKNLAKSKDLCSVSWMLIFYSVAAGQ